MKRALTPIVGLGLLLLLPALLTPEPTRSADDDPWTIRISVSAAGVEGNSTSNTPSVSPDGRFVAFYSLASNLVPGDTTSGDLFVWDRNTGQLTRVPGASYARFSADGRFMSFQTTAALAIDDTNGVSDVYVRDWLTGGTSRVSISATGAEGNARSWWSTISADGRYVSFVSEATNLVTKPLNHAVWQVYVHDRDSGDTKLISRTTAGSNGYYEDGNRDSYNGTISGDGRFVSFTSEADNFPGCYCLYSDETHVYVHDRVTEETTLVSHAYHSPGARGNNGAMNGGISSTGRYIAFASASSDLILGDTNGFGDIFIYDRLTQEATRVSLGIGGAQPNNSSFALAISADGQQVLFNSYATNLVSGDTNSQIDLFVAGMDGQVTRVSVGIDGSGPNNSTSTGHMSTDARYVAFYTRADNVVYCDRNSNDDVFVHDRLGAPQAWPTVASLALDVTSTPQVADGTTQVPVTALVLDQFGRPMPCVRVTFALNPALGFLSATSGTTGPDGQVTVQYTVPTTAQLGTRTSVEVTATAPGDTDTGTINLLPKLPCIVAIDDGGARIAGVDIYQNGTLIGVTDAQGELCVPFVAGDQLIARRLMRQGAAVKACHTGWNYRAYTTSMDPDGNGNPAPFTVVDTTVDQTLVVRATNPLIGYNLVTSIEWDANAAYLADIVSAFTSASTYLYDASDGQMLLEEVTIYDNYQCFNAADYRVNAVRRGVANSHLAGIFGGAAQRAWLPRAHWTATGAQTWQHRGGFTTLIHEFGHYGLNILDSYMVRVPVGGVMQQQPAACTSPAIRTNGAWATNATLMDWQHTSSEFAMRDVAGMWSGFCAAAEQFNKRGMSDWENIAANWNGPGWTLRTPATFGAVIPGPDAIPIPAWSTVRIASNASTGVCEPPVPLDVRLPGDIQAEVDVTLVKATGRIIYQGRPDATGRIVVLGASENDKVYLDFAGDDSHPPAAAVETIHCQPQTKPPPVVVLQPAPLALDLRIDPGQQANQPRLTVIPSLPLAAAPIVSVGQTGAPTRAPVTLTWVPITQTWQGPATLDATLPFEGNVWVTATDTLARTVYYIFRFSIARVGGSQTATVYSEAGDAEVYLPANAVPADTYLIVQQVSSQGLPALTSSPAAAQAPGIPALSRPLVLLGGPYRIAATGNPTPVGGAVLNIYYHGASAESRAALSTARIYRLVGSTWTPITTSVNLEQGYATAAISTFGAYALLAEEQSRVYLPAVRR